MEKDSVIHSPFKFLDPYNRNDHDIFFGRDEEVEKLYESVNKNRLVLIYGQSGTGKTSLVQCGLANRFEVTDWLPFFIRRGQNINASLFTALANSKAIGGSAVNTENITAVLHRVSNSYVRPVYLIFDQFEELIILGSTQEKTAFLEILKRIHDEAETASTHLLFILREEYFGRLDEFEQMIPGFSDRRLRVEPMRSNKLEDVILQTCSAFNVKLEKGRENARQIIDSLRSKGGISLPYFQVYLDMLWREDYQRTDLKDWNGIGHPPLEFTTQEISQFGNIENVLGRFLYEREQALQQEMSRRFPNFPQDGIRYILDAFVTPEGTKRPVYFKREEDQIALQASKEALLITEFSPSALTASLEALEESRLLRADENSFELAHDSLAALIDEQRTDEQKQLNNIRLRVLSAYREFQATGGYLNEKQLNSMEDFFPKLNLEQAILDFIDASYTELARRKEAARAQQEKELQKQRERAAQEAKLRKEAERAQQQAVKNSQRARWLAGLGFLLFFLALAGGIFAYNQSILAGESQQKAEEALRQKNESDEKFRTSNYTNFLQLGLSSMDQGKFREAINHFQVALTFDSLGTQADSLIAVCRSNADLKEEFETAILEGDQAFNRQDYLTAIQHYLTARNLDLGPTDNRTAELKIEQVRVRLLPELQQHLENAAGFIRAERKSFARRELSQAQRIIPYLDQSKIRREINLYNQLKNSAN